MYYSFYRSFGGAGPHILIKPRPITGAAFSYIKKDSQNS